MYIIIIIICQMIHHRSHILLNGYCVNKNYYRNSIAFNSTIFINNVSQSRELPISINDLKYTY